MAQTPEQVGLKREKSHSESLCQILVIIILILLSQNNKP